MIIFKHICLSCVLYPVIIFKHISLSCGLVFKHILWLYASVCLVFQFVSIMHIWTARTLWSVTVRSALPTSPREIRSVSDIRILVKYLPVPSYILVSRLGLDLILGLCLGLDLEWYIKLGCSFLFLYGGLVWGKIFTEYLLLVCLLTATLDECSHYYRQCMVFWFITATLDECSHC